MFLLCILVALPGASEAQVATASTAVVTKAPLPTLAEGVLSSHQGLLVELVTKAGLMPTLSSAGAYTFFVPSEEGLTKLQTQSPDDLKSILSQHIVPGVVLMKDMRDGATLKTMGGGTLRILKKKDAILIDGIRITSGDQAFSNGVWHQLKGVLHAPVSLL
ncbi:hypothetical protein GU926_12280 [Nibribacter ruber]|uniref:FAS1 domain-containing protein n=1 Tax=Nibribacter ruber TaxID=2698458 RepID=A0A6P1P113_9BACT|nr:fasciclin domain-containing protein [Nibribacter ruber]QHL88168.1 hypothetical protein GU926_12280 [Nibribacter ruber]